MPNEIDARELLDGHEIAPATGRPNTILRLVRDSVVVATGRWPVVRPVPLARVQDAIDHVAGGSTISGSGYGSSSPARD